MTKDQRLALLHSLVGRLLDAATYEKSMDQAAYAAERSAVLDDGILGAAAPNWLKSYRDLDHFRAYAQTLGGYKDRRAFVRSEFAGTFEAAESTSAPSAAPTELTLQSLSSGEVDRVWHLALERTNRDPAGALTLARTLLETVIKHILEDAGVRYDDDAKLPNLYKTLSEHLNLAPAQHDREAFKAILGSVATIVSRLGELRNTYSDSHGRGRGPTRIAPRHATLAVNLAGTVAAFIVETWKQRDT